MYIFPLWPPIGGSFYDYSQDDPPPRWLLYTVSTRERMVIHVHWRIGATVLLGLFVVATGSFAVIARQHGGGMSQFKTSTMLPQRGYEREERSSVKASIDSQQPSIKKTEHDQQKMIDQHIRLSLEALVGAKQGKNSETILFIGTDSRHGEAARSDAMLLTRVNKEQNKVLVISIPRDMRVHVPGYGYTKINHALAYGDLPLVKRTVEQTFSIHIDHAIVIDFHAFSELIDAIGGVQITIDKPLNYDDNTDGTHIHLKPGMQQLSGQEALDYVRFRHDALADTGRMERQRNLLHAIADKKIPMSRWWTLGMVLPNLTRHMRSDYTQMDLLGEIASVALAPKWTVVTEGLHGLNRVDPADGLWYFYLDKDGVKQWRSMWRAFSGTESPG
ncbi:MAG: LCP family protein [Acidibacillus sp.]|nr:LCP family protein [Acidibacillus sp.]